MARGFVYLAAVIDWYSRRVPAWRLSISMDTEFCIEAVEEAIARYGNPEIFNTDQGSHFTSSAFTGLLTDHGIGISMDGKGCWRDNVFIERLWRSIKYEEMYLHAYESVSQARAGIGRYLEFYRHPSTTFQLRRPIAGRGVLPDAAMAFGQGSLTPQYPLKNLQDLFKRTGPPLDSSATPPRTGITVIEELRPVRRQ
jgi:putative transposase